ncbi:MAG: hypothetical protein WCP32_11865 [Bacteroidota bacterium]
MVTISGYRVKQNAEGKDFCALILLGGIELVKSSVTDQFYATARKASITSTFTEEVCKTLIGSKLPGIIEKVECEDYKYVIAETGEKVTLNHRFVYNPKPNEATMEETVFAPQFAMVHD